MMLILPTQNSIRNISFHTNIYRLKIYNHNENLPCDKNAKKNSFGEPEYDEVYL
jgi:hypothetical protein